MRVNIAIIWENAPASGQIEIINGKLVSGGIHIGWGKYDNGVFSFSERSRAKICFAVESENIDSGSQSAAVRVIETTVINVKKQ